MKRLLAVGAAVLALAACGGPVEGTVIEKRVIPQRIWIQYQPIYTTTCSGTGATRICTQIQTGSIPIDMSSPECPQLKVRDEKGKTRETCVDRQTYESTYIGQYYREVEK